MQPLTVTSPCKCRVGHPNKETTMLKGKVTMTFVPGATSEYKTLVIDGDINLNEPLVRVVIEQFFKTQTTQQAVVSKVIAKKVKNGWVLSYMNKDYIIL